MLKFLDGQALLSGSTWVVSQKSSDIKALQKRCFYALLLLIRSLKIEFRVPRKINFFLNIQELEYAHNIVLFLTTYHSGIFMLFNIK